MEVEIILPTKNAATKVAMISEKTGITDTNDADMLPETIANAFERDKRRSLSDDTIWSKRRRFRNGKFSLGYSRMLGFKKPDEQGGNPEIDEDEVKSAFITAFNRLISDRERVLAEINSNIEHLSENMSILDVKLYAARDQIAKLHNELQELVRQNANAMQNQDEYSVKYQTLRDCQAETQFTLEALRLERSEHIAQKERLGRFAVRLEQSNAPLVDFELVLWSAALDAITANGNGSLTFKFKNGSEIDIKKY